ncbi:unnamed protein product [Chrysoparadoxa australica]
MSEAEDKAARKAQRKKEKEEKKRRKSEGLQEEETVEEVVPEKKEKKKRKKDDAETPKKDKKKRKKEAGDTPTATPSRPRTRSMDVAEKVKETIEKQAGDGGHPSIDTFNICEETKALLRKRGIESLFPIQAQTFDLISEGKDLLGRARTGMGKTLAFALPVIEKLLTGPDVSRVRRPPRVIVMAPTRELAKQVSSDFETIGARLKTTCIYGGAPYRPQEDALRYGLDIVVGTPGRIVDHMNRGTLVLSSCEFFILDEADQLLDMVTYSTKAEEMEKVFKACTTERKTEKRVQTLLFSATMPSWINKVARDYMSADLAKIDLVGNSEVQASKDVKHMAIPCHWSTRASTISDIISVHGAGNSRIIVFCETKRECNEVSNRDKRSCAHHAWIISPTSDLGHFLALCLLVNSLCSSNLQLVTAEAIRFDCQTIHGDITQAGRESTMEGFRKGVFKVLIATDVAARGLDMIVDLVINAEPPTTASGRVDTETYVHRSGRTGRAGRKGSCVTLYTPKQRGALKQIETEIGNAMDWQGAPQPDDIVKASALAALEDIEAVDASVLPYFEESAAQLIEDRGAQAALCAALACMTGHKKLMRTRSLLSNSDGFVTFLFESKTKIDFVGYVWTALRKRLESHVTDNVRGLQLCEDGLGAVFDIPDKHVEAMEAVCGQEFSKCTTLPPLFIGADEYRNNRRASWTGGRGRGGSDVLMRCSQLDTAQSRQPCRAALRGRRVVGKGDSDAIKCKVKLSKVCFIRFPLPCRQVSLPHLTLLASYEFIVPPPHG